MASMTLVTVVVILRRGSRWQWLVILLGDTFVWAIGGTRLYLGVHYPSDVVTGWIVVLAWATGVAVLVSASASLLGNEKRRSSIRVDVNQFS